MSKYYVTLIYDASERVAVEADNVDEAIDAAYKESRVTLCHYCAGRLDLGDAYKEIVEDEDGNEVGTSQDATP